jgi:hypothetical protein
MEVSSRSTVVALTDRRWFDFLRSRARDGRLDEVNFWRPKAQTAFRSLLPGQPFFFRLKAPIHAIAGSRTDAPAPIALSFCVRGTEMKRRAA